MEPILVTTAELEKHLGDPGWIVFDTRHDMGDVGKGRRAYAEGHVPGAHFLHVDDDLAGVKTGKNGRHPLPDLATFAAKIEASGVTPATQVVVYDDLGGNFAVRLWWMLRWLGQERVALLDGGYPLWEKEKRPTTKEVPAPRPGDFKPRPHLGDVVDTPFIERFREDPSVRLVDARAPERFAGVKEPIDPVPGHIPGAVNRFWQKNLDSDGRFKSPEQLRREYSEFLGESKPQQVVHMCGSGVTACHNMFAMALAGMPQGRLYVGSWSEWVADRSRPVAAR
ncbi:MAG TPA: sulfurtransferase [Usitatibacter sp.]|jgi:thiosulfate/3-mercaptopyruvate sulfurtransferase|nr:sulfurtransferase [Usitatibacter sp.]